MRQLHIPHQGWKQVWRPRSSRRSEDQAQMAGQQSLRGCGPLRSQVREGQVEKGSLERMWDPTDWSLVPRGDCVHLGAATHFTRTTECEEDNSDGPPGTKSVLFLSDVPGSPDLENREYEK